MQICFSLPHGPSGLTGRLEFWPCGFKLSIRSSALPRLVAVWLGFWNSDYMVLKLSIRSLALSRWVAVWLAFWNSDHVVLKLSIRASASPRQQRSHLGLRVTQDAYFSLSKHTKQLLLVTFCETPAGIEVSFRTDGNGNGRKRTDGQTNVEVEIVI